MPIFNDNIQNYSPKNLDDFSGVFQSGVWRPWNTQQEFLDSDKSDFAAVSRELYITESGKPVLYRVVSLNPIVLERVNTFSDTEKAKITTAQATAEVALEDADAAYAEAISKASKLTNVIYGSDYGIIGDDETDDYDAFVDCISILNKNGKLILPSGNILLNKPDSIGGIALPAEADNIIIEGATDKTSIVKLSRNVPRLFDLNGINSTTQTVTYKNITLRNFKVDAAGLKSSDLGTSVLALANVTSSEYGYMDVNVGDTSGILVNSGLFHFPSSNSPAGIKNSYRMFRKKTGSTSVIQVLLNAGETISTGDAMQPSLYGHVLMGTDANNTGTITNRNIKIYNILIENVELVNVGTETSTDLHTVARGKRFGINLDSRPASGYSGTLALNNITFRNVSISGGALGFGIYCSQYPQPANVFIDNVLIQDCFHSTNVIAVNQYNSFNYLVGNTGFGNKVKFINCKGDLSGDVGIETDSFIDSVVEGCTISNSFGSGYFSTNYNYPSISQEGSPTASLTTAINGTATTMVVDVVSNDIAAAGFATIGGTELVYYILTYNSTTLNITRGLNNTAGISHSVGEQIKFFQHEKQTVTYNNCKYNNLVLGQDAGPGWYQQRQTLFPPPNIVINNIKYTRQAKGSNNDVGYTGEICALKGHHSFIKIDGISASISGINHPTNESKTGAAILIQDSDRGAYNQFNPIVSQLESIKNVDIKVDGILDTAATNKNQYQGILLLEGNHHLDWDNININGSLINTSGVQFIGIHLGYNANYVKGTIGRFKMSNNGTPVPVGILSTSTTQISRLVLKDLDFTGLNHGVTSNNANYRPYQLDAVNKNNVFIRGIKHYTYLTVPVSEFTEKGLLTTSNTINASLNDGYIGVKGASATTVNLPKVETGTVIKPNYGTILIIADETGNASVNNITINALSGEFINGVASYSIKSNNGCIALRAIEGGWKILYVSLAESDSRYVQAGTYITSGTGQTTITIPHGLGSTPSFTNVNAKSADARNAGIASWTEDATNITITLSLEAATGANNLIFSWEAKK